MKQYLLLMLSCKIVATDDVSLGTQRILAFTLISIIVLGIEYLTGDAKLVEQFRFPLFAQGGRTNNDDFSLACGPILAYHQTSLDGLTKSHLVCQHHTLRKRTTKGKQGCINLMGIDVDR